MAGYGGFAYGLRQVALYNADGTGKLALPAAMMLHVAPQIESARFEADGRLVGASSFVAGAEWELEAGGISLEALGKLTGLTAAGAGSAPARTLTLSAAAGAQFPYLRIGGRAVAAEGGDVYAMLYRCKVEALEGTFRAGEFWVSYAKGVAVSNGTLCFEFVQQETVTAL